MILMKAVEFPHQNSEAAVRHASMIVLVHKPSIKFCNVRDSEHGYVSKNEEKNAK